MSSNVHGFVEWKEVFISQEKGNRVVHYYFKDASGNSILAVVGTERSVRHMVYVVADEFLQVYGSERSIPAGFKWRSKREVVDWLSSSLVKQHPPRDFTSSPKNDSRQALGSPDFSMGGYEVPRDHVSGHTSQIVSKLKGSSDISWSGDSWICSKQLTHYPAFCRNGITIDMHSFVFVMAKEDNHYLAYLEDMYEDRKGQKKVRARWFHDNREVGRVVALPRTHSREVFITPHAQVISAECVDGPATVLTPEHYEKCSVVLPHVSSMIIHLCSRQFRKNRVKPFDVSRLRGYFKQKILSSLDEVEQLCQGATLKQGAKKTRSCRARERFVTSNSGHRVSANRSLITASGPACQNLKSGPLPLKYVEPHPPPFKVDDKIELLCHDSGIRGCWFRCTILQVTRKQLKVQYDDVQDEEEGGNLEEWVPAFRLAAPDKLGMRCSGRQRIRPRPPSQDLANTVFEIGSPVDAEWNDGLWEGVVTEVGNFGNDKLQVYFPGEDIYSTFERTNLRISRDWVKNQWVDIGTMPDILSVLSADVSPGMKLSSCSPIAKGTESGSSGMSERELPTVPKLQTVEEDSQEPTCLIKSNGLVEDMKWLSAAKRPRIEDEGKGSDIGNEDITEEDEDNGLCGANDNNRCNMEEDTEATETKFEAEATGRLEVTA